MPLGRTSRETWFVLLLCSAAVGAALPGRALAVSSQVPIGARAIAMGGAFSSLADDATAMFWNPAGLARVGHQEFMGAHANLFDAGINDNVLAFVLPLSLKNAVGADWYHSGFTDTELNFGENRFDLAYATRIGSALMAGATLKFVTRQTDLDGNTVRKGGGGGLDFGLIASPLANLRLALVGQDLTNTRVTYTSGGAAVAYPRNVRGGASYSMRHGLTVAADVDDRWHVGAEYTPLEIASLRGGVERDRSGPESPTYTAGAGFKVGVARFDYGYVMPPELSVTHHFSASFEFNFNPSQVRVEEVKVQRVYASLYKTYAVEPFGTASIKNVSDKPITAKFSVYSKELMDAPTDTTIDLYPRTSKLVPLTAVMSKRVMSQGGSHEIQVHVTTKYQGVRLERTDKGAGKCETYGPGAISWDGGVAPAAAFITSKDPMVDGFARSASRIATSHTDGPFAIANLAYTAAIVDALAGLDVAYLPDPSNPYSDISERRRAVDTIQYPRETLLKRSGDCDDTTVLLAALLENVGVATKLVDVPGHIFLLADTGIHERNRLQLGLPERMYTVHDHEVWIPLESTAIGRGFIEAWQQGAQVYQASGDGVRFADVDSSQVRYPPAEPSAADGSAAPSPDTTRLGARLTRDAEQIKAWRDEFMSREFGSVRQRIDQTAATLSETAHSSFLAGDAEGARSKLEAALQREPESAIVRNNLGVVHAAGGNLTAARDAFEAALRSDPSDAGIWLNLGLIRLASPDTSGAGKDISEGLARSGGVAEACRLLGLPDAPRSGRAGVEQMPGAAARRVLEAAAERARNARGALPRMTFVLDAPHFLYWKN